MDGLHGTASPRSVRGMFLAIGISATFWVAAIASAAGLLR